MASCAWDSVTAGAHARPSSGSVAALQVLDEALRHRAELARGLPGDVLHLRKVLARLQPQVSRTCDLTTALPRRALQEASAVHNRAASAVTPCMQVVERSLRTSCTGEQQAQGGQTIRQHPGQQPARKPQTHAEGGREVEPGRRAC